MSESGMDEHDRAEYELMMQLEQLESLKEEMEELGVATLDDIEARMRELSHQLDHMQQGETRGSSGDL